MKHLGILLLVILQGPLSAQSTYQIDLKNELKYILPGVGMNALGLILVTQVNEVTASDLDNLDRLDINSFDRGATDNFSSTAKLTSDILLYSGITVPFIALTNLKCREETKAITVMALETFLITTGVTSITKGASKRLRPFNYNPFVPLDQKLTKGSRLSFFSGHASVTSGLSFFTAKVMTDLNPDMKNKGLLWTAAAAFPAAIGYFRYKAGKHFPTDVIAGYGIGATIGILVPSLHMKDNIDLSYGGNRLSLSVRF